MLTLQLHRASEKHGTITHYLIVVVPEELARMKNPSDFKLEEVRVTTYHY